MNNSYCDDCGAREGEIHAPECSIWAEVLLTQQEAIAKNDNRLFIRDNNPVYASGITMSKPEKMFLVVVNDDYGNEIASIEVDQESHQLRFHGNLDEGSKQFAKFVNAHLQSLNQGDRDGLRHDRIFVDEAAEVEEKYDGSAFHDVGMMRKDRFGRY